MDHVHTTDPRARECWRGEPFVFTEKRYGVRYLLSAPFPAHWVRFTA